MNMDNTINIDKIKLNQNVTNETANLTDEFFICFLSIQVASEGEFILTDKSFGINEEHDNIIYHSFFVVSPKIVLVLKN